MTEKNKELNDINIDQLFDELEAEDKRQTSDERETNQNKIRREYPKIDRELDVIVSKLDAFESMTSLPEKTPSGKDAMLLFPAFLGPQEGGV